MVPDWLAEMDWKNFKKIEIWQKTTCGKAAVLEMLQGAIIFQIFPCIRKLVLQENFLRHIQKYVFFVWCNRIVAVSERYSMSLVFFTYALTTQNSLPSSCHLTLGRNKYLIPSGSIFSKLCFPQQQKEVEVYQNSIRKHEDDLKH